MRTHAWLVLAMLAAVGCGTSPAGEPLISGSTAGSYEGDSFDIKFGVAAPHGSGFVILLSSQSINCDSVTASEPPAGEGAVIGLPALDVNQYGSVDVELIKNLGSFMGTGSNTGSVQLTASTAASVAGMVTYSDTIQGKAYAINGSFEVTHCGG
jgi:hypothetical protein